LGHPATLVDSAGDTRKATIRGCRGHHPSLLGPAGEGADVIARVLPAQQVKVPRPSSATCRRTSREC
jgi:hypothetical protein